MCVCVYIEMQLPLVALPTGARTKPTPPPIFQNRLVQAEAQRRNAARVEEAEALWRGRVERAEMALKSELREKLLAEIRDDLRVNATEKDLPLTQQTETRARNLLDPRTSHPDTPEAVTIRHLVLGENAQGIFQTRLISTWVPRIATWLRELLHSQRMRLFLMANLTTGHHQYLFQLVTSVIHEVETRLAPEFAADPQQQTGPDTLPTRGGGRPSLPTVRLNRQRGLLGMEGQKNSLKALLSWLRLTHFPSVEGHRPLRVSWQGPLVPRGQAGAD